KIVEKGVPVIYKDRDAILKDAKESFLFKKELMEIPYAFNRPIPDKKIVDIMVQIQDADRQAGFTIGGVMKYVIDYTMETRRKGRQQRKAQRIGVSAQRFEPKIKQRIN
ncbi:unnamed protein product, partial [marine sediment metagenome]